MRDLFQRVADWGDVTFPASTDRSKLTHLRKELAELEEHPGDGMEMADVVMLVCHLARAHGVDLAAAIEQKLAICRARTWGAPDADGVVEHVREIAS